MIQTTKYSSESSSNYCPIEPGQVEELTVRIVAAEVVVLLGIALANGSSLLITFLLVDFLLRSTRCRKRSPLAAIARLLRRFFKRPARLINSGPKTFAAQIGVFFSLLMLIGMVANAPLLLWISGGIFFFCALLEAAIGFCVACQIYPWFDRLLRKK